MAKTRQHMVVSLQGEYDLDRLDDLIGTLRPIMETRNPRRMVFDLTRLRGVNSAALALLTAVLRDADLRRVIHRDSELFWPKSTDVREYLLRMDFLRVLVANEEFYETAVKEQRLKRRIGSGFRPCAEFTEPHESRKVAVELSNALGESCKTERTAKQSLDIALSELTDNVLHHADARAGGFAAAQTHGLRGEFEISIVDLGIGVRSSLTKNPDYAHIDSDTQAIEQAFQARVTSTPERNAGIGLYVTRLLLEANGGLFLMRSGHGSVYAGSKNDVRRVDTPFPGTLVVLRARTKRPLDINSVYQTLGDPDDDDDNDRDRE